MGAQQTLRWPLVGSILCVLSFPLVSLLYARRVGETGASPLVGPETGTFLVAILLAMGILNIATMRWLVIPQVERKRKANPWQLGVIALSFSVAPSIYGVLIVVLTHQGALALPFAGVSLIGIALVYRYLDKPVGTPKSE